MAETRFGTSLFVFFDNEILFPIFSGLHSHPNLPGVVTFHQLEILAQVVVGAEAHFKDFDRSTIPRELFFRASLCFILSWTGHLPGQGVTGHHLIHCQSWVGIITSKSSFKQRKEKRYFICMVLFYFRWDIWVNKRFNWKNWVIIISSKEKDTLFCELLHYTTTVVRCFTLKLWSFAMWLLWFISFFLRYPDYILSQPDFKWGPARFWSKTNRCSQTVLPFTNMQQKCTMKYWILCIFISIIFCY